ncbi:MAG: hypothetical protein ACOX88_09795 [Christensenellales bacterium]|jgi:hypothetical protein
MIRNIQLAAQDMYAYFKAQKKSLLVIILCFALALFTLLYSYAYHTGIKQDVSEGGRDSYVFNMSIESWPQAPPVVTAQRDAQLRQYLLSSGLPSFYAVRYEGTTLFNRYENEPLEQSYASPYRVLGVEYQDTGRLRQGWALNPSPEVTLFSGRWLRQGDAGKHRAIVFAKTWPEESPEGMALPETVRLPYDEAVYQVIGAADFTTDTAYGPRDPEIFTSAAIADIFPEVSGHYILIPMETFIEEQYPIFAVTLLFSKSPTRGQKARLEQKLEEIFPSGDFSVNTVYSDGVVGISRYHQQIISSVYIAFLGCVNAVVLYLFWLRLNMRRTAIYMMHGLTGSNLKWTMAIEAALVTMLGFAAGIALYALVRLLLPPHQNFMYALDWTGALYMMLGIEVFVQVCVDVNYVMTYTNDALIVHIN